MGEYRDDAHFKPRIRDAHRGWLWVRADTNRPEAILAALREGEYYSSTGPRILGAETAGTRLRVRTTPVEAVFLSGPGGRAERALGAGLQDVVIDTARFAGGWYVLSIRDHIGDRAWANAFWP